MTSAELKNLLTNLANDFHFENSKKNKLIAFVGLLGDFDSFEYAINLRKFQISNNLENLNIFLIAIGNQKGKEIFCKYTGFPKKNLKVVENNKLHSLVGASKGLNIGLGGWVNMTLMLMGIGSSKTLIEVIRGYTGDKGSDQIYNDNDQINLFNIFKFSGNLFDRKHSKSDLKIYLLCIL